MSIDRCGVGRATVVALLIALSEGLAAQSAGQTTQPPPTEPTANVAPRSDGKPMSPTAAPARTGFPDGVMLKPDATGPAPGIAVGQPTPMRFSGKVGPGGKVNPAIERLGPDGTRGKAATSAHPGPGGAGDRTLTGQSLGPGAPPSSTPARKASPPARTDGQQPTKKPGVSRDSGQVANEQVGRGGFQVFLDPATGQITQPTDAQLQKLDQQNQAFGQVEVVERPSAVSGGGMTADVPASLFPVVTAAIGADGKVTLHEGQTQGGAKDAISQRSRVRQSSQSAVGQRVGAAGDEQAGLELPPPAEVTVTIVNLDAAGETQGGAKDAISQRSRVRQSSQSAVGQRVGAAGDEQAGLELPPPAEVTVTIVNLDAAGEGFNDPTVVAPVFGNRGATLGAQRLNVFRAAAEYWGGILKSAIPIQVDARMDPQTCSASSAVLGSAGPKTVFRDFAGAPMTATWYVQATANSRMGADLDPGNSDINATFNSDVDNPVCLGATSWWYGIGAPAPAGTIDFYTVVLHEIGHGIGFLNLTSLTTGQKLVGFDDAYERWLWDSTIGGWPAMSDAQRAASAVNTGQVIFWGPRAAQAARGFLSAGLNGGYPRVYAPNPVQGGSSISHFDTVLTPNELMEPAITPPPGPYAYLTSGALEDIGWKLLANGVFDFGGIGTWTWNPTDGWFQPTTADPSKLEAFNGNFVGVYGGTWLWNGTTQSWSQLTTVAPSHMKACGNNLLWSSVADGTWRWSPSAGWAQLTTSNPESLECFGGDAIWEGGAGAWLFNFTTSSWSQLSASNPAGVLPCGSRLAWWSATETWYREAATGWHFLAVGPETTACYRGQLAWEGASGTWLYNFTTSSWQQLTPNNPEQMLPWGPNLVWENAAFGTWIWDGAAWTQISTNNPTQMVGLGADLIWSFPGGVWVWGGGGGGAGWTNIAGSPPAEMVSTGQVK